MIVNNKYYDIVKKYGAKNQIIKSVEELNELTVELFKAYKGEENNILEELADVEVMLLQLKIIFKLDEKELNNVKEFKIKRTLERVEKENRQ